MCVCEREGGRERYGYEHCFVYMCVSSFHFFKINRTKLENDHCVIYYVQEKIKRLSKCKMNFASLTKRKALG